MKYKDGIFAVINAIVIIFLIGYGINWGIKEFKFSRLPIKLVECTLLNSEYLTSTRNSHVAPIFSGGKTSWAWYSTGHPEKYTTIWDCQKYGRVVSKDKEVYRYAKDKSILQIRSNKYDTRIVGIAIEKMKSEEPAELEKDIYCNF